MRIILEILGWIVFLILPFIVVIAGIRIAKMSVAPKARKLTSGWHILLIWITAIVSKLLWIESIWLAIGIWFVVGFILGFLLERVFWSKLSPSEVQQREFEGLMRPGFDFRSEGEKKIEMQARAGASLGSEADTLVAELIAIGRSDHFIGGPGGKFNDKMEHIRARQIGRILESRGGMELMQAAYHRVQAANLYSGAARELENAWHGIGRWQR